MKAIAQEWTPRNEYTTPLVGRPDYRIDMQLRLHHYYRVNYDPIFITGRTPAKTREDLWELLDSVGLDYYDRLEWLIRTDLRASCDNLIVERKLDDVRTCTVHEQQQLIRIMTYAGKVREVILRKEDILGKTADESSDNLITVLAKGCAVKTEE